MRRNLALLVCAAGCVCLAGCHRYERTDDSSRYEGRTLSDTGATGSSASPYTPPRRVYKYPADTGYTGSSAAPNNNTYRSNEYYRSDEARPGMVDDKTRCPDK